MNITEIENIEGEIAQLFEAIFEKNKAISIIEDEILDLRIKLNPLLKLRDLICKKINQVGKENGTK